MTPVDVRWGADVNRLRMLCDCGHTFWVRLDRWTFQCPYCGKRGSIDTARNTFVDFKGVYSNGKIQKGSVERGRTWPTTEEATIAG